MKKKTVKLKNMYNGDVVLCDDCSDVIEDAKTNIFFIKVYEESNPQRTFLVNKQAYVVV